MTPFWGGDATSEAEAPWAGNAMHHGSYYEPEGHLLDAQLGYGLPIGTRFVGTPPFGVTMSVYGRNYRLGYAMGTIQRETVTRDIRSDTRVRQGSLVGGTDKGFIGRASLSW